MSIFLNEHNIIYACTEENRHIDIDLEDSDFNDPLAQRIWSTLKTNNGISDSYAAISSLSLSKDNNDEINEWFSSEFPSDDLITDSVKEVIDRNNRNKIIRLFSSSMRDLSNGTSVEKIKSSVFSALASTKNDNSGYVTLKDVSSRMEDEYSNPVSFIETGFPSLDRVICGLVRKKLHIIAGRPAMGKTAFALTLARNIASSINPETGEKNIVSIHSLEMDDESLCSRMISSYTGHSQEKLMRREAPLDWSDIHDEMSKYNIFIDDKSSQTIEHIKSQLLHKKYSTGLDVVIVDYIGIMNKDSYHGLPTTEAIGKITALLREAAKDLNIAIVVLSQLNRNVDARADPTPRSSDLSSSGSLEQDADAIILLFRPEKYFPSPEFKDKAYVIVDKCRWASNETIEMRFNGPRVRYEDITSRRF